MFLLHLLRYTDLPPPLPAAPHFDEASISHTWGGGALGDQGLRHLEPARDVTQNAQKILQGKNENKYIQLFILSIMILFYSP